MENINSFFCKSCNKIYKSYKTFWYHNKTQHKIINDTDINDKNLNNLKIPENTLYITENNLKIPETKILGNDKKKHICEYCNKKFTRIDNMHVHQSSSCIKKELLIKEKEELKIALSTIEELKSLLLVKMNKDCKAHPRTIEKINRALANKYSNNSNSNNILANSNNNNNNGIINNNYNIIALGNEKLENVLTNKQQLNILRKDNKCLEELVKLVHMNDKYPQFKNILITNIMNNIGYIYDEKEKRFITTTKDELLDRLIMHRMCDIVEFYETNLDKLTEIQQKTIQKFIDKMEDSKTFSEKRKKRKKHIKLIIYNNRDKVTNEIVSNLEIYI
jgi:hypothetical protein